MNKTAANNLQVITSKFFAPYKVLVGKLGYKLTLHKIVVQIPYFAAKQTTAYSGPTSLNKASTNKEGSVLTDKQLSALGSAITLYVNKKRFSNYEKKTDLPLYEYRDKVEVRFIRLQYPYLESTILAQYLVMNGYKYNFTRIQKGIFNKVPILPQSVVSTLPALSYCQHAVEHIKYPSDEPKSNSPDRHLNTNTGIVSYVAGVKLQLAGRLTTQRSVPRKTVENTHMGTFTVTPNSSSSFHKIEHRPALDHNQYTTKNKLGVFTMKVWISSAMK